MEVTGDFFPMVEASPLELLIFVGEMVAPRKMRFSMGVCRLIRDVGFSALFGVLVL